MLLKLFIYSTNIKISAMCLDCARFWGQIISQVCMIPVLLDFGIWQGRHISKEAINDFW